MTNAFLDPIPDQCQPNMEQHVCYQGVFRGVYSKEMTIENFLPTYIERKCFAKSFIQPKCDFFSLSLFTSIDKLETAIKPYLKKWNSIVGFAQGRTSIKRGISLKAEPDGHIHYFLYDYKRNNPCTDFCYYADK